MIQQNVQENETRQQENKEHQESIISKEKEANERHERTRDTRGVITGEGQGEEE